MIFYTEGDEFKFEEPTFEVIVKKNGEIIASSTAFEEEETAYDVLRYAGFTASETRDALGL